MTAPTATQSDSKTGSATAATSKAGSKQAADGAQKVKALRDLFADAPELGKRALENALAEIGSDATETPPPPIESAGRVGARLGKVSELTMLIPFAPGGAKRLRAFLKLLGGNLNKGDKVGSLHDMRFVFLENDTKLLFATTYDGDWDAYIDDFVKLIPDYLDIIDSAWEGWPGIRSAGAKDYLVKHQVSAEGWYVANSDLTVADINRLKKIGKAVDEFLDKVSE
jgi:hypothetical protein